MQCSVCGGPVRSNSKYGVCVQTPECKKERNRLHYQRHRVERRDAGARYHKENPEKERQRRLLRQYGLSERLYLLMLASQDGRCAICGTYDPGTPRGGKFCVDHDHGCCNGRRSCGKCVRALLCFSCNIGLGAFKDNAQTVATAAAYLQSYLTK